MNRSGIKHLLIGIINFVFSLITVDLILRFIFKLVGASSNAAFTKFIYDSSAKLLNPFNGIFSPIVIENGYIFEFSTLVAIVIYSIIAWLLIEFVTFIFSGLLKDRI